MRFYGKQSRKFYHENNKMMIEIIVNQTFKKRILKMRNQKNVLL